MALLSKIYPWQSLSYSVGRATDSILGSDWYYTRFSQGRDGNLIYQSERAYENVAVHTVKRVGFQLAEHYKNIATEYASDKTNELLRKWFGNKKIKEALNNSRDEHNAALLRLQDERDKQLKKRDEHNAALDKSRGVTLIKEGEEKGQLTSDSGLGYITIENGKVVNAVNQYGERIVDSLIIWFESDQSYTMNVNKGEEVTTKFLFHFDVNVHVSQSASKNIVLNKVEGRDYTRKELISGGDDSFSVSGEINSNYADVYPTQAVNRLIKICKYNGVVNVKHRIFSQFGVSRVIIQDFKLEDQTYKNVQPYSFTCVAVEPNDNVQIETDTIKVINRALADSELDEAYQAILSMKHKRINEAQQSNNSAMFQAIIKNI